MHQLPLHNPSLTLRQLRPADAPRFLALNAEPSTRRWLPSHVYADLAEAEAAMAYLIACYQAPGNPRRGPLVLAIARRQGGELLGHVGFSPMDGEVEVSYALAEAARGLGLGAEALRLGCDWAMQHYSLPSLLAITAPDNLPSRRTLERAGFRLLGEEALRFQGEWRTVCRYLRR